ncbi:DUF2057 family protein [[Enterobacter] lignolyticus]|uniref:Uncharacterized protein n=1 Tax=[Enterobacter] lignolyticus TaxID=1334193 RepID=A0A806XBY2_9ENTR|nr:DUF2057 family protein [[Enterobacter] lignolyticus]ALR76467.1 hypothetical protein AO703_09200 [[Enterobacter] lignolyticus]
MKRIILFASFIISGSAFANIDLELGDTVVALAASNAKVSMFSKDVSLPPGENQLVIKFDSAVNPESVNQGKGRITSAPYILSFQYNASDKLVLSAQKVTDENEAKRQAANPQFMLIANDKPVPFSIKKIDQQSFNIFSDFKSFLIAEDRNTAPAVTENSDGLARIKDEYLNLSDKQRLSFMKWLLNN